MTPPTERRKLMKAARKWYQLANAEANAGAPEIRVEFLRNLGRAMQKEAEGGGRHCSCHVIPFRECPKRLRSGASLRPSTNRPPEAA